MKLEEAVDALRWLAEARRLRADLLDEDPDSIKNFLHEARAIDTLLAELKRHRPEVFPKMSKRSYRAWVIETYNGDVGPRDWKRLQEWAGITPDESTRIHRNGT